MYGGRERGPTRRTLFITFEEIDSVLVLLTFPCGPCQKCNYTRIYLFILNKRTIIKKKKEKALINLTISKKRKGRDGNGPWRCKWQHRLQPNELENCIFYKSNKRSKKQNSEEYLWCRQLHWKFSINLWVIVVDNDGWKYYLRVTLDDNKFQTWVKSFWDCHSR